MADNTNLSTYDQYNMARVCRNLAATAGQFLRAAEDLKKAKDQFLSLGLASLIAANVDADHVHKEGDSPTKAQLNDLSALVDYVRKNVLADGTVNTNTPAQARVILDRYAGG